jgi:hypothetical protein
VLKKAGIVVAAIAATMLALSPLAFAGGSPQEKNRGHGTEQSAQEEPPGGLIDLDDLDVLSNLNVCPDVNVAVPVGNVLGILGLGSASATQADAPINCTTTDHNG